MGDGGLEPLQTPGESAYLVTLPPGGSASIAFEVRNGPLPVMLWQREAYDTRKDYLSFFRGALLGVSMLLVVALFALYGFRARALYPVAGGFALSAVAFMLLDAGHLERLISAAASPGLDLQFIRAAIETAMAGFLLLLLAMLSGLLRLSRSGGLALLLAGVLTFGLIAYAFSDPLMATALARTIFTATAVLGFILLLVLWWRKDVRGDAAFLSWGTILLWTLIALLAAMTSDPRSSISVVMLAGLCVVLVMLGFVLAHHAFSQGYLSRHFFREAGRHALALAGARTYVWDWQPEDGELYVSPEMGRSLMQPPSAFEGAAGEAFLEIMHPADRSSYLATVEEAALDGRLPIERKFRLRHGDGSYRWFELKARSIMGQGPHAVRCIGTLVDVTNAKLAEERLLADAVYDVVTGLPNRALFIDRLSRAIAAAGNRESSGLFVLLVDLDRFKMVNDAMGHEAGDALLSIIGRRLKAETGPADTIARLPGDQFALLFHEDPQRWDVESFANALLKAVARPLKYEGQEYFLTASIGIAELESGSMTAAKLLKQAAIALYEARRSRVGSVELFNPAMVDERAELVILEAELRRAIERNEIEVHYQPIARLSDMNLAGFEALVRWRHPKLGLLAPESFLGLAEETGMIRDIGRVVLNEAGRQLGIWQRAYRAAEPAFVAVNISSAQLIEPSLLDDVKQIIARESLLRGSLKIEVTESLVMQYPDRAAQILERFRELGVGLSCDDFGTGYSSLASLRKLPFDTLKVDRSFVSPDAQDHRAATILQSIIAMGHALDLTIVAEGIETQEQVDRLGGLGCDLGQGYFIGRPLTAKQVSDALAGLPYAPSATGRTAITWLWERGAKDPPPEAKLRRVTGADLGTPAKRPSTRTPRRRGAAEAPEQRTEPVFDTVLQAAPATGATPGPEGPAKEIVLQAPASATGALLPPPQGEAEQAAATGTAPNDVPPPAPRRRKRFRRVPVLADAAS
jgi:diguanylate cyclase (GGDEF)-like protein